MTGLQSPALHISLARNGTGVVVRLDGELDVATAPRVAEALAEVVGTRPAPPLVVVDADRLTFVDAAGLRPLLDANRRLPPGTLRLRNARPAVARVFRLLDLAGAFGLDR